MSDIGFIGLGNMGAALARRLMRVHRLRVWDLDPVAVDALVAEGATAVNGSADIVGTGIDCLITCLPTSAQVEEVLFGDDGVLSVAPRGLLIADMTTGDPLATREMAERAGQAGVNLVDAPVSGGVVGAQEGTIAIMIGAPLELFEQLRLLLEAISPVIFHAGETGAGHAMKLINNMISSCVRVATFEGLALGVKMGIEPARFAEILSKGSGRGYVADTTLPRYVIPGRLDQGFGLGLMHKDLTLATRLGRELGAPLTAGDHARELFGLALHELGDDVDITQLVRIFENAAEVDICAAAAQTDPAQ
jgi:3-hydroxyisobutyrate dehydrogenase